jgi:hypothetical protein
MSVKTSNKKIKLGRIAKIRRAPRWADIKKFGLKRARDRRINVASQKRWRRSRTRV